MTLTREQQLDRCCLDYYEQRWVSVVGYDDDDANANVLVLKTNENWM